MGNLGSLATKPAPRRLAPTSAPASATATTPPIVGPPVPDKLAEVIADFGPWTMRRTPGWSQMPSNYARGALGFGPALSSVAVGAARAVPTVVEASPPQRAQA